VGPGDEILLRVWGSIDADVRAVVDRNGMLNLPKVGSFSVQGVKAAELERRLRSQIGRLYTNFQLSASLGQLRSLRVFVVGPAQRSGVYTLPSTATLLSAVVAAGGPAQQGSMRRVLLKRAGQVVSELDLYAFLVQGDKSKDMPLLAGDVIVFQPAGPRVALHGTVDTPAVFELKNAQEPLGQVLRYAGGAPVLVNPHQAQLERVDASQIKARFVETFKLDAANLQKLLRDGDVLTLLPISPQFANAVTLKGHVAQPLRYPHRAGMRIRDLIPDREALITPDFYKRKNLLVQVLDEDESSWSSPSSRRTARGDLQNRRALSNTGLSDQADERDDANRDDVLSSRTADSSRDQREQNTTQRATERRAGRASDDLIASARKRRPLTALFDELNWDYAVIERLNPKDLSTQIIPFNLGKAVLQGDAVSNVELLPGDVVTVYSQKDLRVPVARQTRLVSIEGEVATPGVYQLLPGETLKALVQRAGGFTPQAYLYGMEFSREETRKQQRENLNAALQRLENFATTQAARDLVSPRDDASSKATAASINAMQNRLRRLEPSGRIALELDPQTKALEQLPDLPLEHQDHIAVPVRPGFVTVVGAVSNNNAFIWKQGRSVGEYIRLAGIEEAADASQIFVLRADGTVASNTGRGWFSRGIDAQPIYPGDAVIVPNQLDFETWGRVLVRNLRDWSQIFSQFGLGAVAVQTLRRN
jgi:protein involved in polysaccharide export with SLBB domain